MIGFSGPVKTQWIEDKAGRDMFLLETITFTDSKGKVWTAPEGSVINGADIPRFFWRVVGSPYCGLHRRPSVIHDVYCVTRSEPHELVHKMFYEAMLIEGMDYDEARQKYLAVRDFGPKWDLNGKDLKPSIDNDEEML